MTVGEDAVILQYPGNMTADGQVDEYTFSAPVSGRYRFEISELASGSVNISVFNSSGSRIGNSTYIGNGRGLSVDGIIAGETYTVQVIQNDGLNPYVLSVRN